MATASRKESRPQKRFRKTLQGRACNPHSAETHKDLQKGISLLKRSVACVNSLCLDVPSDASTFEAFAKLLATLSSSKEVRSVFNLKIACSRYISSAFH